MLVALLVFSFSPTFIVEVSFDNVAVIFEIFFFSLYFLEIYLHHLKSCRRDGGQTLLPDLLGPR